ncbi:hypothetical protein [Daejeonella oryzae]|uniref:hypothetical protein n=1 Tax=Daejeonella oryzae TaxID=1122943 RepID=UPI00047ACEEC|nr:hypothetical protein [Daejeonella oryzae]
MKKIFTLLVLAVSISAVSAQTEPAKTKSADKSKTVTSTKKDCKKGDECCMDMKSKKAAPAAKTTLKKS